MEHVFLNIIQQILHILHQMPAGGHVGVTFEKGKNGGPLLYGRSVGKGIAHKRKERSLKTDGPGKLIFYKFKQFLVIHFQ